MRVQQQKLWVNSAAAATPCWPLHCLSFLQLSYWLWFPYREAKLAMLHHLILPHWTLPLRLKNPEGNVTVIKAQIYLDVQETIKGVSISWQQQRKSCNKWYRPKVKRGRWIFWCLETGKELWKNKFDLRVCRLLQYKCCNRKQLLLPKLLNPYLNFNFMHLSEFPW